MKIGVEISINLSKVDKSRITTSKKGEKFLNLTSFIDTYKKGTDQDDIITHKVSKEERQQGVRGGIVGNSKIFWQGESKQDTKPEVKQDDPGFDDDIPF